MQPHLRTRRVVSGSVAVGGDAPPLVIAGPDTLESEELVLEVAAELGRVSRRMQLVIVFKGSYDKANRSSHLSYRGPGLELGLELLGKVKETTGLPVTSDVHTVAEIEKAAAVLDVLQIPAFLCRQNDLLRAAGATGKLVNIKKGQFLAPASVPLRVAAATGPRTPGVIVTERGTTFGHGDLVNDFRTLPLVRSQGIPVVFDATHSVQRPAALGDKSGGNRELIPYLARAAAGAGCDGFFFEVHPTPDAALCDGPSSLPLGALQGLLEEIVAIDRIARGLG
jgi:2-dehydro-3-deoxyphosphooctonate aldolase (KDO 8-P synthase)